MDTGYKYDGRIIREEINWDPIKTTDVIKQFVSNFTEGKLTPYLKSEPEGLKKCSDNEDN
jgi:hypothetical protein